MIEEAAVNIWLLQKQNTTYISHIYVKTVSIVSAHIRVNITSFAVFDRERYNSTARTGSSTFW